MKHQLTITRDPIIESDLVAARSMSHGMGAAVYFTGVVRATEEGAPIKAIEYEAFEKNGPASIQLALRRGRAALADRIDSPYPPSGGRESE